MTCRGKVHEAGAEGAGLLGCFHDAQLEAARPPGAGSPRISGRQSCAEVLNSEQTSNASATGVDRELEESTEVQD